MLTFPSAACGIVTRPAGISRIIFKDCAAIFTDLSDLTEWQTFITAEQIRATGYVKGSKAKGSFTKKKLASCQPEQVTGKTSVINFVDANSDPVAGSARDYLAWNQIQAYYNRYDVGYLTCDGLFYGWIPAGTWSLEVDDVRADNNDEEANFDGSISYTGIEMVIPELITGLNAILI